MIHFGTLAWKIKKIEKTVNKFLQRCKTQIKNIKQSLLRISRKIFVQGKNKNIKLKGVKIKMRGISFNGKIQNNKSSQYSLKESSPIEQLFTHIKKEKEPSLKELMSIQREILRKAEIPIEDVPSFVTNVNFNGERLHDYAVKISAHLMDEEEAIKKVKIEFNKFKSQSLL